MSSSAIYVALGVATVTLGSAGTRKLAREAPLPVTFVQKVAKPDLPAPPLEVARDSSPPPAAAPVVPPDMKVRQLDKLPPRKQVVAPKEMPQQMPEEADPGEDKGVAVYGAAAQGDPAGLEGGAKGGVVGGEVGIIWLPDDAVAPVPSKANAEPEYPRRAKAEGKTGVVIFKVTILADGTIKDIETMGGEEPFVTAAMNAVKTWTYEPARFKGQPISVYRTIRVKFEIDQ